MYVEQQFQNVNAANVLNRRSKPVHTTRGKKKYKKACAGVQVSHSSGPLPAKFGVFLNTVSLGPMFSPSTSGSEMSREPKF